MDRPVNRDPRREAWKEFICSPAHAGRHLSSIGESVAVSRSDQINIHELSAFLDRLAGGDANVSFLANIVTLTGGGYVEFFEEILPDLLEQLSSETERLDQIVGPALIGAPRWGQTRIARRSGHLRFGQYYSRTAHRSYDLPENRVLAWLVEKVGSVAGEASRRSKRRSVPTQLHRLAAACDELGSHPVLWSLRNGGDIDHSDLSAAETSSRAEYRLAAELCQALLRISEGDPEARWHAILMLLAVDWLEPVSDDDLFELFVLLTVIDALSTTSLGEPSELGLVMGGRRHVAKFETDTEVVTVHFDLSAWAAIRARGRYMEVIHAYDGVTGSERRPDIIVERKPTGDAPTERLFMEIKRSDDGRYISDGVYKIFGYLHDHRELWDPTSAKPHAALVVPAKTSRRKVGAYGEVAIVSGDDRTEIHSILEAGLGLKAD